MDGDVQDLINSYKSAYDVAVNPYLFDQKDNEQVSIRTIAMCCISTGIYGFENETACFLALRTTRDWLEADPERAKKIDGIVFCTFLKKDQQLYEKWLPTFFPVEPKTEAEVAEIEAKNAAHKQRREEKAAEAKEKAAARGNMDTTDDRAAAASSSSSAAPSLPSQAPELRKRKSGEASTGAAAASSSSSASAPSATSSSTGGVVMSPQRLKMLARQEATRQAEAKEQEEYEAKGQKRSKIEETTDEAAMDGQA